LTLSSDASACSEILAFVRGPIVGRWPSPDAWLDEVPGQRSRVFFELIVALTENQDWQPESFERSPTNVPCGTGSDVTDELWESNPLSVAGVRRPDRLYASFGLQLSDNAGDGGTHVELQAWQDFDCDGVVAQSVEAGVFRRGVPALAGGWVPTHNSFAAINE
jgi:hypothetical protein